jgi:GNAT superfamily N-acetyltransferase
MSPLNPLAFRQLRADSAADAQVLQTVLAAAPAYSLLVQGEPPSATAALEMLSARPPGKAAQDKFAFLFSREETPVGCADVVRGHPSPDVAFIGLLLFTQAEQGRSNGVHALGHIATVAAGWGCTALRIAVIETNLRALAFWRREGFAELYRKPAPRFTGQAIVMERTVLPPASG